MAPRQSKKGAQQRSRDSRENRDSRGGRNRSRNSREDRNTRVPQNRDRQGGRDNRGYRDDRDDRDRTRGRRSGRLNIRTGEDVSILEGRHAFEEALEAGASIESLFVSATLASDPKIGDLIDQACAKGAKLHIVDTDDLASYSSHGAHQGLIAQLKPYTYAGLQDLVDAATGKDNALIIATDHVTDAGNFGAIVRSAEVVGASGILIPNKRNARVNTAAYKTSAGAVLHMPIAMEANLTRSLEALKDQGFWVVGASEHAEDVLWDASLSGRVVLVMGSEGDGLSRLTQQACDLLVKLPQAGKVESLNVAQATTALAYEWLRQCTMSGN